MSRIAVGSKKTASAASAIVPDSPNATAGDLLVLEIAWNLSTDQLPITPSAPSGWSTALAIAASGAFNGTAGYSVFYKTAAGGVESPSFAVGSAGTLYASAIISQLTNGTTFDATASSGANSTNNAAASTTGVTVPSTGTLASANSQIFTGVSIAASTGLSNAAIAFSGGSWTTDFSDQNTSTGPGTTVGFKAVAVNTALNAVYTWTSDSSMISFQAGIVVFSDPAGGTPIKHLMTLGAG